MRWISDCSSSSSSTASEMSRFRNREPYMNSSPPIVPAMGATIVSAVRSPWASESAPASRPPKNPPIRKMNTGTRANAWVRMRYGATAPTIGPMLTNAELVHAPASATPISNNAGSCIRTATSMKKPYATMNAPASRTTSTGSRRNSRSYVSPAIGIATIEATAVNESIHPRVYAL